MSSKDPKKPNILFILTDDHGHWALGCAGNHEIKTPNIDELARSGIRFENFFCTSPVCSPARASILTGKMPSQHGIMDWLREGNYGEGAIDYLENQVGYTDILAKDGYNCGISGKWHLGNSAIPQKSFNHWFVHKTGSGHYYNAPMIRNGVLYEEKDYITDVITEDAISYIKQCDEDNKPFYLSVHYTAPHDPWNEKEHPKDLLSLYKDCNFETCPQNFVHPDACYKYDKVEVYECLRGYFAAVSGVDKNVGKIIETLDKLEIRDNTIIIFMGDNGFNCGHHGIWGKGNGTFSLNMFDTSVKVPCIISHIGKIPENVVCDELLSQYDIFPTLLEYVELKYKLCDSLPGKSFVPILKGMNRRIRSNVVVNCEYGPVRMIRDREWKYIHRYPFGKHELYDLVNDPDETVNLFGNKKYKKRVEDMKNILDEWFFKYADPAIDGVKEPVKGNGQLCKPGIYSRGKNAFDQNRTLQQNIVPIHIKEADKGLR